MLFYCALCFVVLTLVDTAIVAACFALALAIYEFAFLDAKRDTPLWWALVQLAIGAACAMAHRTIHRRGFWKILPVSAIAALIPRQHHHDPRQHYTLPVVVHDVWQRLSTSMTHYMIESLNNVLMAVILFVLYVVFYKRRLDGKGDFPVGICIVTVLSCGLLFLLDVFHYYDRETLARRDRAFQKADAAAAEMRLSSSSSSSSTTATITDTPLASLPSIAATTTTTTTSAIFDRKDMYGIFTSYSLLFISLVDLCVFELAWWQVLVGAAIVPVVLAVAAARRELDLSHMVVFSSSTTTTSNSRTV